ncbi:hypothetical protein CY652_20615 [Burkholderia sp. WAC0059]|uniref:hypothetical protein n=1 Tax=Burkholderia sp. WAC0059 TaxID=2066022 RepID=UPI000C7ED656|nr:hypothetical protein [Burkholderia sp. WAC0059]PLZ00541.1 hypothetical protein CY652_20615 [Burkholderia sp. WAC0059]
MKVKSVFLAVLFALVSTVPCAMENPPSDASAGVAASAAISGTSGTATTGSQSQPLIERIRTGVAAKGVDPDTPQGKLLVAFLAGLLSDPQSRAAMANAAGQIASLRPGERLRVLNATSDAMGATPADCEAWLTHGHDLFALARTLSPQAFQSEIEFMEILSRHRQSTSDEQYTTAELLDAEARLNAASLPGDLRDVAQPSPAQQCELLHTAIAAIDAMPEPLQQRASFEFVRVLAHQPTAVDTVLSDPEAYLDAMFDEQALPETIRGRLPADGSRPLPFRRLVIDGEWVSQIPGESGPIRDIYVNRHNNGVVSELLTPAGQPAKPEWANFILSDGFVELRQQSIWKLSVTPLAALSGDQGTAKADGPFAKGETIVIPQAQPQPDLTVSQQCTVGGSRPASTVFPSLSGVAVDMQCVSHAQTGEVTAENQDVWLPDYHVAFNMSWRIKGKAGHLVIHNITIE